MKRLYAAFTALCLCQFVLAQDEGQVFEYKYTKGDKYRVLSTVSEDVLVNHRLDHRAEILNRISVEVTGTDEDGGGEHRATYMTSEKAVGAYSGKNFTWGNEYGSVFTRSSRGIYTISDEFFMPVVRDVPVFPDYAIKPGDTWEYEGHEAHDLRAFFGVETPYKIPFTARYAYVGTRTQKDAAGTEKVLHEFTAEYNLYFDSPAPRSRQRNVDYPVSTQGFSKQTILWDSDKGAIDSYSETFSIAITTAMGDFYEFRGTAGSEITEFTRTATEENVRKIQEQVEELGVENVSVTATERGLTLSIENIQFKPDSAVLQESEKLKIEQLAKVIAQYPNNDLLVAGHTALAGSERSQQVLSEERAKAVADYLTSIGAKDAAHIFTQGFGATQPVADNTTAEGMAKNRRVEITILDK